jgi:hypothetical protein
MKPQRGDSHDDFRISVDYVLTGVSSWLVPGSGHWLLGYRLRGAILGLGVIGLFWVGESALANNMAVSRETSPIFYGCQMGNGLSTLVSEQLWGKPRYSNDANNYRPPDAQIPRYYHFGVLFTTVSGLLNMLAVLHVLDPDTWRRARADQSGRGDAEGAEAGASSGAVEEERT